MIADTRIIRPVRISEYLATFNDGEEGWCSYDYARSVVGGNRNVFVLGAWAPDGGVNNTGYIWSHESRWSPDILEKPISVLPFLLYARWVGCLCFNLCESEISMFLCGRSLNLDGGKCYFWVHGYNTRWHFIGNPLVISDDEWASEPEIFSIEADEDKWHMSWSGSNNPCPLNIVLSNVASFGLSFRGFTQPPTGVFALDNFSIKNFTAGVPHDPV